MPVGNMSKATRAGRELAACSRELQSDLTNLAEMKAAYNHDAIKHMLELQVDRTVTHTVCRLDVLISITLTRDISRDHHTLVNTGDS